MPEVTRSEGRLVEPHEDLESLWRQAEHIGQPEIERSLFSRGGYHASIHLEGGDVVRSEKGLRPHAAMAQAIRKARALLNA